MDRTDPTPDPRSTPPPHPGDPRPPGLPPRLLDEPFCFDFFQAVRLIEQLDPSRVPIGHDGPPRAESVRIKAHNALSFPPSSIHDLKPAGPSRPTPELIQSFFGLFGPSGVLPRHYTQLLIRQELDGRTPDRHALRDWLDLFNHRLSSFFFRAWQKYRLPASFERAARNSEPDPITAALFSLIGLGSPSLRNRIAVRRPPDDSSPRGEVLAGLDDRALLSTAGLLAPRVRGSAGLESLIRDCFGVPVSIESFQGRWIQLDPENWTRIGGDHPGGNNRLGDSAIVGDRLWDVQGQFRVRLGPLSYDRFEEFLPDRAETSRRKSIFLLAQVVRLYAGPELDFDIQLLLRGVEVPPLVLVGSDEGHGGADADARAGAGIGDASEAEGCGPRLGWNTWLDYSGLEDAEDAAFAVSSDDRPDSPGAGSSPTTRPATAPDDD